MEQEHRKRKTYPSDLTDAQWLILEPLIPAPRYRFPKSFVPHAVHASTSPSGLRSARTGAKTARPERSAAKSKGARGSIATHLI